MHFMHYMKYVQVQELSIFEQVNICIDTILVGINSRNVINKMIIFFFNKFHTENIFKYCFIRLCDVEGGK